MKLTLFAGISMLALASAANANSVQYSSQGGLNTLDSQISGTGNSIGATAPGNTSTTTAGTYQSENSLYQYYDPYAYRYSSGWWGGTSYRSDYYGYVTNVKYTTTVSRQFPTDYSFAKQVGDNNLAMTSQSGTDNKLNFSQGSDTVFTETRTRRAVGSTRNRYYRTYTQNNAYMGRNYSAESSFNSTHGYHDVFQRGAVTTASNNYLGSSQNGSENNALINQLGDNNYADLYQSGTRNDADLMQASDNSWLDVDQYGLDNSATVRQYSMNTASLYQSGNGNGAGIYQGNSNGTSSGLSNNAVVSSSGSNNYVTVVQSGSYGGNSVNITQSGSNNISSTRQTGQNSAITLTQSGTDNNFNANQSAIGKNLTVAMVGNGGNVNLTQY